jgi:hypothetical protein
MDDNLEFMLLSNGSKINLFKRPVDSNEWVKESENALKGDFKYIGGKFYQSYGTCQGLAEFKL